MRGGQDSLAYVLRTNQKLINTNLCIFGSIGRARPKGGRLRQTLELNIPTVEKDSTGSLSALLHSTGGYDLAISNFIRQGDLARRKSLRAVGEITNPGARGGAGNC